MSRLLETVAGWSAALPAFTCREEGAPFDLTNYDVELVLCNAAGTVVTVAAGQLVKLNQVTDKGKVQFTPNDDGTTFDPTTFTATRRQQIYTVRVKVTDSDDRVVFFPDLEAAEIVVNKQ